VRARPHTTRAGIVDLHTALAKARAGCGRLRNASAPSSPLHFLLPHTRRPHANQVARSTSTPPHRVEKPAKGRTPLPPLLPSCSRDETKTPKEAVARKKERKREQQDSLRIHAQPRPILLHEAPEDVLGGLVDVVSAGVFGEVAFEGDLRRVSTSERGRKGWKEKRVRRKERDGRIRGTGDEGRAGKGREEVRKEEEEEGDEGREGRRDMEELEDGESRIGGRREGMRRWWCAESG
jgi:hypothetical protein